MTEVDEKWLPIVGYEGLYEVSSQGRVRWVRECVSLGKRACRLRKPETDRNGYLKVTLHKKGAAKRCLVHRLVAEAFIGPPPGREMHCCHSDGNPANNAVSNLRWDTIHGNRADRIRHGTHNHGERHSMAVLTEGQVTAIAADPRSQRQIASDYGISQSTVHLIKARKVWRHLWQPSQQSILSQ